MDEILKDIYTWSVYSEEKKLNFNGHFIASQHPLFGNVVIDPPQASDSDLEEMESLGFVQHIIMLGCNNNFCDGNRFAIFIRNGDLGLPIWT